MTVRTAFQNFLANDFESACDSSTIASWSGGSYSVELFDDGHYRVMDTGSIGNLYSSPGLILTIPAMSDDERDEDANIRFYDNALEAFQENFEEHYQANLNVQHVVAFND